MEKQPTRIAVIGIIVEDPSSVEKLNATLHNYSSYILGRMGIPYREKNVSIIRDRKSTRLNSSHITRSRMPSSA